MRWVEQQKANRIEERRKDRVGVPADHFDQVLPATSVHKLRVARRAVRAAIRQRDAR